MEHIIFIPGLLCDRRIWADLNLLRNDYTCYDADVSSQASIAGMADAIVTNVNENIEYTVIGISMGGYVAIELATRNYSWLKKLVLINTTASSVDESTIADREKAILLARKGELIRVVSMSNGICFHNPRDEYKELEKSMAMAVGSDAYINQQHAIINRRSLSQSLSNIKCNTLVIAGYNDTVIPYTDSVHISNEVSASSLRILNKCGHLSTIEKSKEVYMHVKHFLKGENDAS